MEQKLQPEQLDFLWIELTNQCNLQCTHCYAESGPHVKDLGLMNIEKYKSVILSAFLSGCRKIQFIGGEPTLSKDLRALIEFSSLTGYETIEVFTNLFKLTPNLLDCLIAHQVNIATSVYGPTADVHDRITTVTGSFDRMVAHVKRLIELGLHVRAGFIEQDSNAGMYAPTREFMQSIGVEALGRDRVRQFGRGAERAGQTGGLSELCGDCGRDTLCVSAEGKVSPCIMSKAWSVGTVAEQTIGDILSSVALADLRRDIRDATMHKREAVCDPKICQPYDFCQPKHGPGHCEPTGCTPCYPKGIRRGQTM